jgi:hypothetical protein
VQDEEYFPRKRVADAMCSLGPASINLAVCGDYIVGRALVLLLRDVGYNARFAPTSSLGEAGALEDVHILLLMPERNTERREATVASLEVAMDVAALPTLDLVAAFQGRREPQSEPAWLQRKVPWPCSIFELKRHIDAALSNNQIADRSARHIFKTAEEKSV